MNIKTIRKIKRELYSIPRKHIDFEIIIKNYRPYLFGTEIPEDMAKDIIADFLGKEKININYENRIITIKNINPKNLINYGIYYLVDPEGNRTIIWDDLGIYAGNEESVLDDIDNILK